MPPRLLIVYTAGQVIPYFSAWEIQGVAWERVNWLQHIMIQGQCRVQWRMRVTSLPEEAQVSVSTQQVTSAFIFLLKIVYLSELSGSFSWMISLSKCWRSRSSSWITHKHPEVTSFLRDTGTLHTYYINHKKRDISKYIYCYSDLIRTQIIQIRDFMYFL